MYQALFCLWHYVIPRVFVIGTSLRLLYRAEADTPPSRRDLHLLFLYIFRFFLENNIFGEEIFLLKKKKILAKIFFGNLFFGEKLFYS